MGTRSLTHIIEDDKTLATIYRQYDGYLSGHGQDLAEFLQSMKIVNGFSSDQRDIANGMGCLSAQIISHLKQGVGNIYLYPPNSKDCWEEYTYHVYNEKIGEGVKIKAIRKNYESDDEIVFEGTPEELLTKIKSNA